MKISIYIAFFACLCAGFATASAQERFLNGSFFENDQQPLNDKGVNQLLKKIGSGLDPNSPAIKAIAMLGTPYKYGSADDFRGQDCSGFVLNAYKQAGIALPRSAKEIASRSKRVPLSEIRPGDIVFFNTTSTASHTGIYLGENLFAHSPRTGQNARVDTLSDPYWRKKFLFAAQY